MSGRPPIPHAAPIFRLAAASSEARKTAPSFWRVIKRTAQPRAATPGFT